MVGATTERIRDRKVCETCLSIPSNQDVVLNIPNVNMRLVRILVRLPE